jgi:hypothetical protein
MKRLWMFPFFGILNQLCHFRIWHN